MKIGIIGLGFVGLSLATFLGSKGYKVIGIDSDLEKISKIKKGEIPFYEPGLEKLLQKSLKKGLTAESDFTQIHDCEIIFVTVGTPQQKTGKIDLRMIKNVSKKIGQEIKKSNKKPVIVIKSTVTPTTTEKIIIPLLENNSQKIIGKDFGVISNPEFLRESKAVEDTKDPHIIVIGGKKDRYQNILKKLYQKNHSMVNIVETNFQTAEMIKYANNSFLATKISFINQIARICESIPGANVQDVALAIGIDPRIGNLFLEAGPGYGGSCLPKDVKAMIDFSKRIGVKPNLLSAVEETNVQQIQNVIKKIEKILDNVRGKKIAVLGTSFKPFTDDVRDSVSIDVIRQFLSKGAKIKIHDPKAIQKTRDIFGNKIEYSKTIKDVLRDTECCLILTPWPEYKKISNQDINLMKKKIIFDTRRILFNKKLKARYYATGIGE